MKDKNQTIKLNSSDIYIYLEPNTNSNLLRFTIYNPDKSRVKFLHNNKIYETQDVEKAQGDFYIGYQHYKPHKLRRLTDIHLGRALFLRGSHYSRPEISDILSPLTPLVNLHTDLFLGEFLAVEKEFIKCQERYVHSVQEKQTIDKDTNEYCNF